MVEYRKNTTVKIVKWLSSEEIKLAFVFRSYACCSII